MDRWILLWALLALSSTSLAFDRPGKPIRSSSAPRRRMVNVQQTTTVPTGLNMPPLDVAAPHYGGAWASATTNVFIDLFKHSTPFETQSRGANSAGTCCWGWGPSEAFNWRADGYPAGLSARGASEPRLEYCAMAKVGVGAPYYAAGTYVLLYDGMGQIQVTGDANVTSAAPNRLVLDIKPANGFFVRVLKTNATNPLTNIRIVPIAYEATYATQGYTRQFLEQVSGFKVLRFTTWQKIFGDTNNAAMKRNWTTRATPASQSYIAKDGVSIEHMVLLSNKVLADPWFSMPMAVDDNDPYVTGFATYVANNLNSQLNVYVEFGKEGPGWMGTTLAANTARMAKIWRSAFTAAGADPARVVVAVTYMNPAWIPYFDMTFDAASKAAVDVIAVPGVYGSVRSWNSHRPCYYEFNNPFFAQNPANANLTLDKTLQLVRSSVIHSDVLHNNWKQRLAAAGKRLVAIQGGPDSQMQAAYYAARQNYQTVKGCTSFPCTRNLFDPASPKSITLADAAARDAALDSYTQQAEKEWNIEELLLQVKLRESSTRDHVLDHLWRWEQMGGDVMIMDLPAPTSCNGGPGTVVMPPRECQAGSGITNQISPESSPIYKAIRDYQAGKLGQLPRSAHQTAATVTCNPACAFGTCAKGQCVCWAGYSGAACDTKTSRANQCNSVVGINLEGIADYSHSWTFVDIMKSGRAWISQAMDGSGGWGNTADVSLNPDGWVARLNPNQKAGTMMVRDLQGHLPAGTYTVTWEGEGVLDFSMDVDVVRQLGAGKAEVDLKPSTGGNNGLFLTVERTNPANPVRNIKVLMPGFDQETEAVLPFHPRLLTFLSQFGVIRFMDWMKTNGAKLPTNWTTRAKSTDRSFATNLGGVSLDHMIKLVNNVGAAPWFNMPHLADEGYQRAFAQQVKDTLRPDVKVFVEWSNEVWHTGFPGGQYAQAEGVRLGYNEEGSKYYYGAATEARLCYYAERTKQMSQVWKDVFGSDAARVVIVAQGQAIGPLTSDKALKCRGAAAYIDALAIGPYFGSWVGSRDTNMESFMNRTLLAQVNDTLKYVADQAKVAAKYNKSLMAYEAGQGLTGDNPFPINANRHPGMYEAYKAYMHGLVANGVQLTMHYSSITAYSRYGSFGLMEWMDDNPDTAYKLKAVREFITSNAKCGANDGNGGSGGNQAPSCPGNCSNHGECLTDGTCSCYAGYSGLDCNITSLIDNKECGYKCSFDQGICKATTQQGSVQNWGCTCNPGFSGLTCSLFNCSNSCNWQGTCLDKDVCSCFPGYTGANCEIDCKCNKHGICKPDNTCACDVGYKYVLSGCEPDCIGCPPGSSCIAPGECGCSPSCKYGTCFNGRCECWSGYTGRACDVLAASSANKGSPVGMNVAAPSYWTTQWIFIDVMKTSSKWFVSYAPDTSSTNSFSLDESLPIGPTGYPMRLPASRVGHKLTVRDVQLHGMPGRYVALYDGDGLITFDFDAKVASMSKGRIEFDFTPTANLECAATGAAYCGDNGIHMTIKSTNPDNPIRNIRILHPGFEKVANRVIFHPWFLKSLERYSVLRFMDWVATNQATFPSWTDRTTPQHDTQARPGGVALEYIIRLCNELGASPWINVHHLADDEYVRNMAAMFKDQLRPDLQIYVEHSNEVWNSAFPQGQFAQKTGLELGLATDKYTAAYKYHGKRSEEIFDIFTTIFGANARTSRLKFVVGTWGFACNNNTGCGIPATTATLSYGKFAEKADLVAVTGYFDCGLGKNPTAEAQMTLDALLDKCNSEAAMADVQNSVLAIRKVAASFGLPIGTYEAGPSILESSVVFNGGGTAGAAEKYIALQRDPRFAAVYSKYLGLFDELGLINSSMPFMHFTSAGMPSKYGSFGLVEYTGQDPASAPRYQALHALLDSKMPPTSKPGCLSLELGHRGLGDAAFFGMPAILSPEKGAVWVQDGIYNVTFPRAHAPTDPVTISVFQDTDCSNAVPLFTTEALSPKVSGNVAYVGPVRVPGSLEGHGFFLRVQSVASGRRNYSEIFAVQKLQVTAADGSCIINPALPASQPYVLPPPRCNPELRWNVSNQPTGICMVESNGCRSYRTSTTPGAWSSIGKPVTDCTAQQSPSPSAEALKALGVAVGPLVPGGPC